MSPEELDWVYGRDQRAILTWLSLSNSSHKACANRIDRVDSSAECLSLCGNSYHIISFIILSPLSIGMPSQIVYWSHNHPLRYLSYISLSLQFLHIFYCWRAPKSVLLLPLRMGRASPANTSNSTNNFHSSTMVILRMHSYIPILTNLGTNSLWPIWWLQLSPNLQMSSCSI